MCQQCVINGKMTQEEFELDIKEGKHLVNKITDLLEGKEEYVVINTLLSCLIQASRDLKIEHGEIILALINGFGMSITPIKGEEIRH